MIKKAVDKTSIKMYAHIARFKKNTNKPEQVSH